jgi:hypothetical protein
MKKATHPEPGNKFNQLSVISYHHTGKHYRRYFVFKCDCGNEKIIHGSAVTSGNTKSCGCMVKEGHKKRVLPDHGVCRNNLLLQYKRHAKGRDFSFELTKEQFSNLICKPCYYCGIPPSNLKKTKNDSEGLLYTGIDRVNPKLGYSITNCVPACSMCNRAKRDMTKQEYYEWVKRLCSRIEQWG